MPRKTGGKAADQNAERYFNLMCEKAGLTESSAVALFNDHIKSSAEHGGRGTLPWALDYLNGRRSATKSDAKRILAMCAGVTTQQAGNYLNGKTPTPRNAIVNVVGTLAGIIETNKSVPHWGPIVGAGLRDEVWEPGPLDTGTGRAHMYAFGLLIAGTTPFEDSRIKTLKALYIVSQLEEDELNGVLAMLNAFKPYNREPPVSSDPVRYSDENVELAQNLYESLRQTVDEIGQSLSSRAAATPLSPNPDYIPFFF